MKVLEIIKSLEEKERNQFEKFLISPFHNDDQKLIILYKKFITPSLTKTNIKSFKEDFLSKTQWSSNQFAKKNHELLERLIDYLAIQEFLNDKAILNLKKYELVVNKGWTNLHQRLKNKFESHHTLRSPKDLLSMLRFKQIEYKVLDITNPEVSVNLTWQKSLLRSYFKLEAKLIDLYTLNKSLILSDDRAIKIKRVDNQDLIEDLISIVDKFFQTGLTEDLIDRFIGKFKECHQIDKALRRDILMILINHFIVNLNKGQIALYPHLYKFYKIGLEENIIYPDVAQYRNIAFLACKAGKFLWALNFVDEYKETLPLNQQDSAYSFTKARIYINMQEWVKVLETLRNVEYEDIGYNLNSKLLIIAAYYELDEYEALDSFIKSFKVFLRRRRNIPVTRKNAFYDFTTVVDHLMKAGDRGDAKRLIKAREVLDSNAAIPNKDWVLEKIEEIEAVIKK